MLRAKVLYGTDATIKKPKYDHDMDFSSFSFRDEREFDEYYEWVQDKTVSLGVNLTTLSEILERGDFWWVFPQISLSKFNTTEKKSFGIALILWFVLGVFGAHRVYVKENVVTLLYYWLLTIFTFGILPIVDLFLIKSMVMEANGQGKYAVDRNLAKKLK